MNSPPITLREAEKGDVPLLLELIRELAEYEEMSGDVTAKEEELRETLCGENRIATAVLAFADNMPTGYAVYFFAYSTFRAKPILYLEDLFVRLGWRRRGVGRKLLKHLIEIGRKQGCARVEWSVLSWNDSALQFYESVGGRRKSQWVQFELANSDLERAVRSIENGEGEEESEPASGA